MTEAIIPALCNNHSSIFQLRLISGRALVRTIYSWASVISSLRFRLWLEQLISLISNVTSTISHSTSSSHQLRAAFPRAAPAFPEWAGLRGGSLLTLGLLQLKFEPAQLWDLQVPTHQYKSREGEELKTEKLGTGGISLDGRLGFWRVGNIGLESEESEYSQWL